uniref:Exodeoxyribonuclease III n=1 Tax=OCS116 cluster bacterium TaxID=2030921 RepID=A0A2A4YV75_9PROT
MKIVSWNVNSINVRHPNVVKFLKQVEPDILLMQELKMTDEKFPREVFEDLGYNVATHGQKTYNGVAILSKHPIDEVITGLPFLIEGDEDEQSRYIEAVISVGDEAIRVASIYLPNGNPVDDGSDKYPYKLRWFDRLIAHAKQLLTYEEKLLLGGDYNIIPGDDDVWDAERWRGDALILPETRAKFRRLQNLGFTDCFVTAVDEPHQYTFWDYQAGAWPKNHGIRIDHLLVSAQLADCLSKVQIESYTRDWEKPSDHVPIMATFDL